MRVATLAALADDFDVFLLDQFGVLLDGVHAYPGATEALSELSHRGKRIAILSNSGRRSGPNADRLEALGFNVAHIDAVVSSGEAAYMLLDARIGRDIAPRTPVLVLSRGGDRSCIAGLDLTVTENPDAAELVLISGSRGDEISLDDYRRMLESPAARAVPAYCTNPDMTMLSDRGLTFGAGQIAALYRSLGGQVEEIGKPHPLIYEVAAGCLDDPDPSAILCIGDSPAHDIRGAHAAGFSAALVRTGIHANEPLEEVLANSPETDRPDFVLPAFAF